jgi:iron complex outermembrane receptor protein
MAYKDRGDFDRKFKMMAGAPIRSNSEKKSYHLRLEVDASIWNYRWLYIRLILSANKNTDLAVEGQDYGTTDVHSPSVLREIFWFYTSENLHISWIKNSSEQYMNNIELPAKLADYFVQWFKCCLHFFKPTNHLQKKLCWRGLVMNNFST